MVATQAGVELDGFEYDRASKTYESRYDTASMPASMGVIATLSKVRDRSPTELEPLQAFVDTDALDEFFRDLTAEHVSVTFPVTKHTVTVYGTGQITVAVSTGDEAPTPAGEGTQR